MPCDRSSERPRTRPPTDARTNSHVLSGSISQIRHFPKQKFA